ncbi:MULTISPECIES: PP2C family serine/threonine-protein phosphatase [unclassified Fusibacter]|uniref:PP2C family serine/threonine-protein phosphatase n=1 Tax=unclassified Fusibacter TaxID=2624464 RepID=UPI001011A815|nr:MULTISPECIES: PP2C family serine/threonine-protein phosphatase [unclassified Fusibacter]MCK8061361.1 protein phosphatase 2C domain-containing protein [Fusibacter sp. A2]NPE23596.1 protein phosphatase 2C domain-containing protein [Fusibacter sp. A1]RXV59005.1 protein phosphatase 2C domain-containing protein [Fusibacter sp. A1]
MSWDVVKGSVIGPSHIKSGLPNQDAFSYEEDNGVHLVGVADGHGSSSCFRSHIGSRLATEAVIRQAKPLSAEKLDALDEESAYAFTRKWGEKVLKAWVKDVLSHLRENPFTQSEVDGLDDKGRRALGKNALLAYGATLIAVIITPNRILGYNLGDGDLLVAHGRKVICTVYKDDDTIGNSTYSLCTSGSMSKLAHLDMTTEDLDWIMIATDGYRNSFKNEKGFYKVGKDLHKLYRKHGLEVIEKHFEGWLHETTQGGSGDDLTSLVFFKNT